MTEIDVKTQLCGLLGNPVEHSLSPAIHNAAFRKLGLNFVYLAFKVEDLEGAMRGIRALGNLRGFSVTIPHKVTVMEYLDEVETTARHIGSVNTILVDGHRLKGYNTDALGAIRALEHGGVSLKGKQVLMLGSGGAARAIAFALGAGTGISGLTILGVDEKERGKLAEDLRNRTTLAVEHHSMTETTLRPALRQADLLLHCTPVGMHPKVEESCIPATWLNSHLTVMDIVYNPRNTRLLREAKAAGCRIIPGLDMFLHQAIAQFELWTGRTAPADVMRAVLESHFS
ncbi:MAG TPA: shikimate dehydrogenase [Nitrospiraceae bacterium]|jgi:shikimate dehydrogenase|nr:shikimate dehydrogenase [Nitrospiraceae bacterium]